MPTMYQRSLKRMEQFEEIYEFAESKIRRYAKENDLRVIYTTPIGVVNMGSCGAFARLRDVYGKKRYTLEIFFSYEDLGEMIIWNKSEVNIKLT